MTLTRGVETGTQVIGRTQTAQEQRATEYRSEQARLQQRYSTPEAIVHYGQMVRRGDIQILDRSEREQAERARAAEGARIVAEARASRSTGMPAVEKRHGFFEKISRDIKSGLKISEGKEVQDKIDVAKSKEKYITRGIFDLITEKTADYRRFIELEKSQKILAGVVAAPTFFVRRTTISKEEPVMRLTTGVLQAPAMLPEIAASVALGTEHAIKTKGRVFKDLPVAAGVMLGGMKYEATVDPFRFAGEMVGMPLVVKAIPTARIPTIIKAERLKAPRGLVPEQAMKFKAGAELAVELKTAKPPKMEPLTFTEVKALPGETGRIVETWIREHPRQQPVIGGSTAAKVYFEKARTPGDIDIYVKKVERAGEEIHALLAKEIPKTELRLKYQPKFKAATISTKDPLTGEWHHAVDIHQTEISGALLRYGMETQKPIKIGGIYYIKAGELLQRKAESILQKQEAGKIGPQAHRRKDIPDFESFVTEMLEVRKGEVEKSLLFKGRKAKKVKVLEEEFETYQMYSDYGYHVAKETARWYEKLTTKQKLGLGLAGIGIKPYEYPKRKHPRLPGLTPLPYIPKAEERKIPHLYPDITPDKSKPYVVPDIPEDKTLGPYPELKTPDEVPYPYLDTPRDKSMPYVVPDYPLPIHPILILPPEMPPVKPKPKLKDKEKLKYKKGMPEVGSYAWHLANPIATLEEMMGGRQKVVKKPAKSRKTASRGTER